jgi:hypothetical protein
MTFSTPMHKSVQIKLFHCGNLKHEMPTAQICVQHWSTISTNWAICLNMTVFVPKISFD